MEILFQRLMLIGSSTVLVLHFPELIAWIRLRRTESGSGDPRIAATLRFLRKLLRIVFFFYIVLLAYTLDHPVPSALLVYPLPLIHLIGLIVGERDLLRELPQRGATDMFVRFLITANILEIGLLTVIALQIHGIVPA